MKDVPVHIPEVTPDTTYFVVEFPGYLRDLSKPEKALETFGGLEGLQKQRKSHSRNVSVKLRPDDQFCHAVISNDVRKTNMMLLRLDLEEEKVQTVPVTQSYAFHSPADMQVQEMHDMLQCIPPVFEVEGGVEYAVDAYGSGRDSMRSRVYSNMWSDVVLLEYGAPSAPKDIEGYYSDGANESKLSAAGQVLRKIFKKRPVYTNSALVPVLLEESNGQVFTDKDVNEQLALLCYRFTSGPWRYSWIRKGYDPRHERQSSVYHVITLTDTEQQQSSVDDDDDDEGEEFQGVSEQQYGSICTLKTPIAKLPVHVHAIDIENDEVQDRLTKSLHAPSRQCTEDCGWHVEFSLSKICDTIKEVIGKVQPDILIQHAEPKETSKRHVRPFSFQSTSQEPHNDQLLGKRLPGDTDDNISPQLFDILPDEYHDAIRTALAKVGGKRGKQ